MECIEIGGAKLYHGNSLDVLRSMADASVQCCVTSPPYFGLRDYGCAPSQWEAVEYAPMAGLPPLSVPAMECCLGLEPTPEAFVAHIVMIFREVRRLLRDDGTLWLNFGDSYYNYRPGNYSDNRAHAFGGARTDDKKRGMPDAPSSCKRGMVIPGLKQKDLIGIPWRVAFALQADGWYLRQDIIWHKPNPMPESVTDRCTKAHEYMFLLTKNERYFYDHEAVKEQGSGRKDLGNMTSPARLNQGGEWTNKEKTTEGRNKRSVWTITPNSFAGAHFATFPPELVEPCIMAGSKQGDVVLDVFNGSGTTGLVAVDKERQYIGMDINAEYLEMARERLALAQEQLRFVL